MKAQRPYLLRALYEWIVDSDSTPYLLVKVDSEDVIVPQEHVQDGQIILNVSPNAVRNLDIADDALRFDGRFGGKPFDVWVPHSSIAAIYAKENGQGMMFTADDVSGVNEHQAGSEAGKSPLDIDAVDKDVADKDSTVGDSSKANPNASPATPKDRNHLTLIK